MVFENDEHKHEINDKIVIRPEEVSGYLPDLPKSVPHYSKDVWLAGGVIAVILSVLAAGGVLVLVLNLGADKPGSNKASRTSSRESIATLAYWNKIREIGAHLENKGVDTEPSNAKEYATQLQQKRQTVGNAIDQITRLATLDVDQDAIEVGSKMAELLSEIDVLLSSFERLVKDAETFGTRSTSADMMVESFVRGFFGDPLGTHNDLRAEQGALSARHQRLLEQVEAIQRRTNELRIFGTRTRATLTNRYGVEFPPLD